MLVLLLRRQCLVLCVLTIEVYQQFFCTFCVVRGRVVGDCWFVVGDSWSGHRVAVGHSDHVVDVGFLKSKSAVVADLFPGTVVVCQARGSQCA